ncbi:hypothetical protein AJ78_00001 [Emergomyces pasteurianus Ep9510]|uniref:Uncharacterized protein n=1 Tax=Emergomyces pasteurianus Ep9510 TaxID=1447872 RepID=A0A1J9PVR4_9EURO|nr:hypothetical protein AJ78_00001 [Emergomyces pasteurianus Ep9510]
MTSPWVMAAKFQVIFRFGHLSCIQATRRGWKASLAFNFRICFSPGLVRKWESLTPDNIPRFGLNGTLLPDGNPDGFISASTIDFGTVTVRVVGFMPEEPIQEARQLLLDCLKKNSNLEFTADDANTIASSLEPVMLEQADGDLTRAAKKMFGSSKSETLLHFFQFCVYLSSNNMMPDEQTHKLLRWLSSNRSRYMLKDMLQSSSTTVEVFASNLLLAAVKQNDVDTIRILLGAGVDADAPSRLYIRRTPFQVAVGSGNNRLVQMLLDNGANPNGLENGYSPLHDAFFCLKRSISCRCFSMQVRIQTHRQLPEDALRYSLPYGAIDPML